jgi:hypothetical protein
MTRLVRLVVWLLGEEGDVVADARTQVMAHIRLCARD